MMPAVWARVCGALLQLAARASSDRQTAAQDEDSARRRQGLRRLELFRKASGLGWSLLV
jgi:hypothetical protein